MDKTELLKATLDALERLLRMFAIERYIYLALTALSFLLLLYAGFLIFKSGSVSDQALIAMFGGSGLVAVSSARISWFFNRAFSLVENLVKRIAR
jgi:hypothetical protein